MEVPARQVLNIPLHDATIVGLMIEPLPAGFLNVSLKLKINPEEPLQNLSKFRITTPEVLLAFRCWQVRIDLLGYAENWESISTFDIEENSSLKDKMLAFGISAEDAVHFAIHGSLGSKLDLLSSNVSVNSW